MIDKQSITHDKPAESETSGKARADFKISPLVLLGVSLVLLQLASNYHLNYHTMHRVTEELDKLHVSIQSLKAQQENLLVKKDELKQVYHRLVNLYKSIRNHR